MAGIKHNLPCSYDRLSPPEKREVREQYIELQNGLCWYCHKPLEGAPPRHITDKRINWKLFPPNFLVYNIHLQHDHNTGLTEGAVHAYCNAVLWQYEGR